MPTMKTTHIHKGTVRSSAVAGKAKQKPQVSHTGRPRTSKSMDLEKSQVLLWRSEVWDWLDKIFQHCSRFWYKMQRSGSWSSCLIRESSIYERMAVRGIQGDFIYFRPL